VILPYIEEVGIASKFNLRKAWFDNTPDPSNPTRPTNLQIVSEPIPLFRCPSTEQSRMDENFTSLLKPAAGDYGSVNGLKTNFADLNNLVTLTSAEELLPQNLGVLSKNTSPPCKIKNITDGLSKTIMVAEDAGRPNVYLFGKPTSGLTSDGTGWADPDNGSSLAGVTEAGAEPGPTVINGTNAGEAYSFHVGGAQFCFADGSAHFISESINPFVYKSLVTRAGREVIPANAFE